MSTNNLGQVERTAKQIVKLIEPLGDLEQHAALQMAETIRAYTQVSRSFPAEHSRAISDGVSRSVHPVSA